MAADGVPWARALPVWVPVCSSVQWVTGLSVSKAPLYYKIVLTYLPSSPGHYYTHRQYWKLCDQRLLRWGKERESREHGTERKVFGIQINMKLFIGRNMISGRGNISSDFIFALYVVEMASDGQEVWLRKGM